MATLTVEYQPKKTASVDIEIDNVKDVKNVTEIKIGDQVIYRKQELNLDAIMQLLKESGLDTGDLGSVLKQLKVLPIGGFLSLVTKILRMLQ